MSIVSFAIAENLAPGGKSIVNPVTIGRMNKQFFSVYGGTFGKRVRLLRQERGWTQIKLSEEVEKLGSSAKSAWISELENADENRYPSIEVVVAFAKALRTTTDFLLLQVDDPSKPGESINHHWSEEADATGKIIDLLPQEWRAMALEEVNKLDAEWKEIQRQDQEIIEMLTRVERIGGAGARAEVEKFVHTRLKRALRTSKDTGSINETSSEGA